MKINWTLIGVVAGHMLERYEIVLCSLFGSLYATSFFPTGSSYFSTLASFSTFAAGYIMRPLGGVIIGHIGDKYGRKKAFLCSTIPVAVITMLIGVLPTYEIMGYAATTIFLLGRLLQGFCIGGEYCGAAIFFFENTEPSKRGVRGSLICASGFYGGVLALGLGMLSTLSFMPSWGWRVPFILGGTFGFLSFYIRCYISETRAFQLADRQKRLFSIPILEILKTKKLCALKIMAIAACYHTVLNFSTLFLNDLLRSQIHCSGTQALLSNILIMSVWGILIPLVGFLSDKWGQENIMRFSSLLLFVVSLPLLHHMHHHMSMINVIFTQIILSLIGAFYMAPSAGFIPSLFEVQERYSGIGFSLNIGQSLIGANAPLFSVLIINIFENPALDALILIVAGFLGFWGSTDFSMLVEKVKYRKSKTKDQNGDE